MAITLINPDGKYSTLPGAFTYVAGPPPAQLALMAIAPGQGDPAGGTQVFISGQGFLQGAAAQLVDVLSASNVVTLANIQVIGPTAITATIPAQPASSGANWDLHVRNTGSADAVILKAWTYGTGTRRYVPQGTRLPLESNSRKYNRPNQNNRNTVAWQGVTGDFTQSSPGVTDVVITGYDGRNPRLYQGSKDPLGTNAVAFRDVTATNLLNADGSPVRDQCCGASNWNNRTYYAYEPRSFVMPNTTWPNLVFWNDGYYGGGLNIFWNNNGVLTNTEQGASPYNWGVNDYVGGGNDMMGAMIDFNLDGYPDFAFAGEGSNWVMLSCGTGFARPDCGGALLSINGVVTPSGTAQTVTYSNQWQDSRVGNNAYVGAKLIIDAGANQEVVTITGIPSSTSNQFTAVFTKPHPAGVGFAPYINMTSTTQVVKANTDVTVKLPNLQGIGMQYYQYIFFDAGTPQEERFQVGGAAIDYTNKTIAFRFAKTHTLAGGMTVTTGSSHLYVADASRFTTNFGQAYSIVAGDVDGNGSEDLITGHTQGGGSLHVWLNNASTLKTAGLDPNAFTFTEATATTFNQNQPNGDVHALAFFPTSKTNLPDLLVGFNSCPTCPGTGSQELLFVNQGGGKYLKGLPSNGVPNPTGCTQPTRVPQNDIDAIYRYEIADVDGNGALDVLTWMEQSGRANTTPRALKLWLNDGTGCFFGQTTNYNNNTGGAVDNFFNGLPQLYQHILGDINKDGLPDMIMPFNSIQTREYINQSGVLTDKTVYNLPDSRPGTNSSVKWWAATDAALLKDVNGDGYPDLITSVRNTPPQPYYYFPTRILDTDGSVKLYLNDQSGNFPVDNSLTNLPTHVNGNNKVVTDLPIATNAIDSATVDAVAQNGAKYPGPDLLLGNMSTYSTATIPFNTSEPWYNTMGSVRLLLNQPDANGKPTGVFVDGTYPRLPTNSTFMFASQVKFADLSNSGHQDIIIGQGDFPTVRIWQNTGNGYFVDVTGTALIPSTLPAGGNCYNYQMGVRQLEVQNFDKDSLNLPDVMVAGECTLRLLINHSDTVNHKIVLVDETESAAWNGNAAPRIPSPPGAVNSIVTGDYDCNGSPDVYLLAGNGNAERVLLNSGCQAGQQCGYFSDVSGSYLPPASRYSGCIGTDCYGNSRAIGVNYQNANTDILISRYSDDDTVRPYRLLLNTCGGMFNEVSQASWMPFPSSNDKTWNVVKGNIFGQSGNNLDLLFLNNWGPRIYRNMP